jgi:uncharacterized protein
MTEIGSDAPPEGNDRRLGDEWLDWNGSSDPKESEVDEKPRTFLILAGIAILIMLAALRLGWYLAKPRFEQISVPLSHVVEWSALSFVILLVLLIGLETVLFLKFRRSLIPYIWAEKIILSLLSKAVWLGAKFGISRDRVGNSFIKAHNLMLKSHAAEVRADTFLILLPRCLEKNARRQVVERANGRAVQIVTATGGEEARKAIKQYRPSLILAIACERDLISGIRDVAEKVPVLAVPNKRPEGPCKNTRVYLEDLDEALKFIEKTTDGKAE